MAALGFQPNVFTDICIGSKVNSYMILHNHIRLGHVDVSPVVEPVPNFIWYVVALLTTLIIWNRAITAAKLYQKNTEWVQMGQHVRNGIRIKELKLARNG